MRPERVSQFGTPAMIPAPNHPPTILVEHIDQRVRLHDISWEGYESFLALRGEQSGARVTYWNGELELMSPSINHEIFKKTLARLLEAYAEERGIELNGYGSWTVKSAKDKPVSYTHLQQKMARVASD